MALNMATCHLADLQMDGFWYLPPHTSHAVYFLYFLFYYNLIDPSPFTITIFANKMQRTAAGAIK